MKNDNRIKIYVFKNRGIILSDAEMNLFPERIRQQEIPENEVERFILGLEIEKHCEEHNIGQYRAGK